MAKVMRPSLPGTQARKPTMFGWFKFFSSSASFFKRCSNTFGKSLLSNFLRAHGERTASGRGERSQRNTLTPAKYTRGIRLNLSESGIHWVSQDRLTSAESKLLHKGRRWNIYGSLRNLWHSDFVRLRSRKLSHFWFRYDKDDVIRRSKHEAPPNTITFNRSRPVCYCLLNSNLKQKTTAN